jgi:hypothetical protein
VASCGHLDISSFLMALLEFMRRSISQDSKKKSLYSKPAIGRLLTPLCRGIAVERTKETKVERHVPGKQPALVAPVAAPD